MKQITQKNKLIICSVGIVVGIAIILCSIFLIDKGNSMPSTTNNSSGPSMPSGSSSMTPPDNSTTSGSSTKEGPSSGTQNNQGPMNNNAPSNMNNGNNNSILKTIGIIIGSLILSLSLIYLIMSRIGKNNIFESTDKKIIYILINIIFVSCLSFGITKILNKNTISNSAMSEETESNQTTTDDSSVTTPESV